MITLELKKSSKRVWQTFPLKFGFHTLWNFTHAEKELKPLYDLKLATIPAKLHDPTKLIDIITIDAKMRRYVHENNHYDELFCRASSFIYVCNKSKQLSPDSHQHFLVYRDIRKSPLPLNMLKLPEDEGI